MKLDRPNRSFTTHPHLISWIESDLKHWLDGISERLARGYAAHPCAVCDVPKGNWMVRPGSVIDERDEVVVNAILGRHHERIWKVLGAFQGDPDIAYQFQCDPAGTEWVRSGFLVSKQWREKSVTKLTKATRFVLFTDIAGFYENTDLPRLASDLRSTGMDDESLNVLIGCVRRWSHPRDKGIPQGYSASDILAKLYLNRVDVGLRTAGFTHLRYVDDIRVFCKTRLEAKRALLELNKLLRNSGLNLQTAKTHILRREAALQKIDGVTPTIDAIQEQLAEELRDVWAVTDASGTLADIDSIISPDSDSPTLEVLEKAFEEYFFSGSDRDFNKTLFHYLLTRLGRTRSRIAVAYCIELLSSRPEETGSILRYFEEVILADEEITQITDYAGSRAALYDYQLFEIVRWFVLAKLAPPPALTDLCRKWWSDRNRAPWLRTWSLALLGELGALSDLENIEHRYGPGNTELENAEIVAALSRMEAGRRNAFYKKVGEDGDLIRRAISTVRGGRKGSA